MGLQGAFALLTLGSMALYVKSAYIPSKKKQGRADG